MEKKNQDPQKKDLKKKEFDPLFRIKYFGYHMSQLPKGYDLRGLLRFAKFHLCLKSGKLMKDPIWDSYSQEQLLVEFFAHKFAADAEFKAEFEFNMEIGQSVVDDFAAWADKEIAKASKERQTMKEQIEFDSSNVMGE